MKFIGHRANGDSPPAIGTPYVSANRKQQSRNATQQAWKRRYERALAMCGSAPMRHALTFSGAIGLTLVIGVQPALDARDEYRAALHREQGKNIERAAQDAKLIKHYAEGTIKLEVIARKEEPRSMRAVAAALTELGGKQ